MEKIKLKIKNEWYEVIRICFLHPVSTVDILSKEERVKMNILQLLYKKILNKTLTVNPANASKLGTLSLQYYQAYFLEELLREKIPFYKGLTYELNCIRSTADQLNQKIN